MLTDSDLQLPKAIWLKVGYEGSDVAGFFQLAWDKGLSREVIAAMSWADVCAHRGYVTHSLVNTPELASDLMARPEAGLLFASEILGSMRAVALAKTPDDDLTPTSRKTKSVALDIVKRIQSGDLTVKETDPVNNGGLLRRIADVFDEVGPPWALDRDILEAALAPVDEKARAGESKVKLDDGTAVPLGDLLEYAATRDKKVAHHPSHRLAKAERFMRGLMPKGWH